MALYEFRYFFDPKSGTCLWSANDTARDKFGYAVELESLGLSETLLQEADELLWFFDTSIDWSYPAGPSPWTKAQKKRFAMDSYLLLEAIRDELGADFAIRDESKPIDDTPP